MFTIYWRVKTLVVAAVHSILCLFYVPVAVCLIICRFVLPRLVFFVWLCFQYVFQQSKFESCIGFLFAVAFNALFCFVWALQQVLLFQLLIANMEQQPTHRHGMQVPTSVPAAAWMQSWTHVNAATTGESTGRQLDGVVDVAQPIETVEPGAVPPPVPGDSMSSVRTVASMNPDDATDGTNLTEPEISAPSVMTASDSSAQTDGNSQHVNIDDTSVHMVDQFNNSAHTCRHIVNNNRLTFNPVAIVKSDNFHFVDNSISSPPPTVRQTPVT